MTNRDRLGELFRTGKIAVERGALFERHLVPKPTAFDFDRVEGMLLGVAVGDGLGITTEGRLPGERGAAHGRIRDYLPNRYTGDRRGYPSDDTQLTFWTLEQMILDRGFVPERVAARLARGRIFGIGSTVRQFLVNLKSGKPWYESGPGSAGNGALMRISPMLIPHLKTGGTEIWVDTALSAMMTHNDPASISACLAYVAMLWDLLDMEGPPDRQWWVDRYVALARDLEGAAEYSPRGGAMTGYRGPLWRFVQEHVPSADREGLSVADACGRWYSGAFLLETVPSVLFILTRHADDPEEAILAAVNDTKDNDSIAAIVGAAVGALHGRRGIPQRWLANLSGRTTDRDEGRVFSLLGQARSVFG